MSRFVAVTTAGLRIMSVKASSVDEASREIVEQLARPGRYHTLAIWKRDGKKLIEEKDQAVPACPGCGAKKRVITQNELMILGGYVECKCGRILHPTAVIE